jgi:hypothetical protein
MQNLDEIHLHLDLRTKTISSIYELVSTRTTNKDNNLGILSDNELSLELSNTTNKYRKKLRLTIENIEFQTNK